MQFVGIPLLGVVVLFTSINLGPQGRELRLEAEILESEGTVAAAGDRCEVHVEPVRRLGGYNCRVTIHCGSETFYGGPRLGGFLRCESLAGHYQRGFDHDMHDGDPAIDLDLVSGEIEVRAAYPEPHRVKLGL